MISTVIAAIRTFATLAGLAVFLLLVGVPALIWTALSRDPRLLFRAGGLGVWLGFMLSGIRVELVGTQFIQTGRAAVYAANHSSNIEPPVVFYALRSLSPRLSFLYKAELRKVPILVWVFDAAKFVPLERANRDQSLPAVDQAAKAMMSGQSFIIFPEGTRSRSGELLPFKKGGFVMALQAQAPVVPVAVSGAGAALRRGSMLIHPATVRVEFAPPVSTAGLGFSDRTALAAEVRAAIEQRLPRRA